ncbi:peroxiredoxin [bacterium]|nr:peroxiredoxin [bacterium]
MPLIGDPAPAFDATTTNGPVHFPTDYAGKWVILFSHPSDFTSVCTSEFMAFQAMQPEFNELNTQIIGLSVGTIPSHLAWIDAIKNQVVFRGWKNMEITFPVIADPTMEIAQKYGMIHPNANAAAAVRAVFIIDPRGVIRAIIYYPASLGRSFDEIKRALIGLQMADAFGYSAPADWMPGDDVLVGAPNTTDGMRQRERNTDPAWHVLAWFMTLTALPADTIMKKLRTKPTPTGTPRKKK